MLVPSQSDATMAHIVPRVGASRNPREAGGDVNRDTSQRAAQRALEGAWVRQEARTGGPRPQAGARPRAALRARLVRSWYRVEESLDLGRSGDISDTRECVMRLSEDHSGLLEAVRVDE